MFYLGKYLQYTPVHFLMTAALSFDVQHVLREMSVTSFFFTYALFDWRFYTCESRRWLYADTKREQDWSEYITSTHCCKMQNWQQWLILFLQVVKTGIEPQTWYKAKISNCQSHSFSAIDSIHDAAILELQEPSPIFSTFFSKLLEILVSQGSSNFSHNPCKIPQLKSVPFGRY